MAKGVPGLSNATQDIPPSQWLGRVGDNPGDPWRLLTCLEGGDGGGYLPAVVERVEGDAVHGAWLQPCQLVGVGAAGE